MVVAYSSINGVPIRVNGRLVRRPLPPGVVFIAPPDGSWAYYGTKEPGMLVGSAWTQDTTHGFAYPRDLEGSFCQQGVSFGYLNRYACRCGRVQLDAAKGYGGTGNLIFRIIRISDFVTVYEEYINQYSPGVDDNTGSNRTVSVPYGDYYIEVDFDQLTGGICLFDGIGIAN